MRTTLLIASAGLALHAGALAKPLNPAWTPNGAPWVLHLDMDAALASHIGKLGFEGPEPILHEIAEEIEDDIGFDFIRQVHSVTIYGMTAAHDEPVIIISTTPEAETRLTGMAMLHGGAPVQENGRTVYEVEPDSDDRHFGTFMAGPGANERLVIISPRRELLHSAVDVIEGKGQLRADLDQSALRQPPRDGSILYVAASAFGKGLDLEPVMVMLQRAEGLRVDVGEVGGEMYVDVDMRTPDEQQATQLHQMALGGIAMLQFVAANEPEMAPVAGLAQKAAITLNGRDLSLRFRHSSEALMELLHEMHNLDIDMDHDHDHDDDEHGHVHEHRDVRADAKVKVNKDGKIEE